MIWSELDTSKRPGSTWMNQPLTIIAADIILCDSLDKLTLMRVFLCVGNYFWNFNVQMENAKSMKGSYFSQQVGSANIFALFSFSSNMGKILSLLTKIMQWFLKSRCKNTNSAFFFKLKKSFRIYDLLPST